MTENSEELLPSPKVASERPKLEASHFALPPCPVPRPGDIVVWFQNSLKLRGVLIGHNAKGEPHIQSEHGGASTLTSYDQLRLDDPAHRVGPCWSNLQSHARMLAPTDLELQRFNELLDQRIPPGPKYIELAAEIWSRGFEVFVVGGTVRDIIAGGSQLDVDLVTTMPLIRLLPIVVSMYGQPPRLKDGAARNGHFRLGGVPRSGDPYLDISVCKFREPGMPSALFSADLTRDTAHRDFSCNAIYYDPVNKGLIDPSGVGIPDATSKILRLVCDSSIRSPIQMGQIGLRYVKFVGRGFEPSQECRSEMRDKFMPSLSAMPKSVRVGYVRAQILNKYPKAEQEKGLRDFREQFLHLGFEHIWLQLFESLTEELLGDD